MGHRNLFNKNMSYKEIEVRFLEIDKQELISKLNEIGAEDKGSDFLKEIIFYDKDGKFREEHKFMRIRENKSGAVLTYKQHMSKGKELSQIDDVDEVETKVGNPEATRILLEKIGFEAFRYQEKNRHSFVIGECFVEVDEWPSIPTYVEIEGPSEDKIRLVAEQLGLDWSKVYFGSARDAIEKIYNTPVSEYKYFTFEKIGN